MISFIRTLAIFAWLSAGSLLFAVALMLLSMALKQYMLPQVAHAAWYAGYVGSVALLTAQGPVPMKTALAAAASMLVVGAVVANVPAFGPDLAVLATFVSFCVALYAVVRTKVRLSSSYESDLFDIALRGGAFAAFLTMSHGWAAVIIALSVLILCGKALATMPKLRW